MKPVLDTHVVRSGLQSAGGASRLLLRGVVEGAVTPLVTVATLLGARGLLRTLSEAEQSAYLRSRAARARSSQMAEILAKGGTTGAVRLGDDLPEDWLGETSDRGVAAPGA
jgi:hypothetical protein